MSDELAGELTFAAIGILVLLNIIFSTLIATLAEKRNQSWGLYFIVGLIFGFGISILFVLLHDAIHRHWRAEDRHALQTASDDDQNSTVF